MIPAFPNAVETRDRPERELHWLRSRLNPDSNEERPSERASLTGGYGVFPGVAVTGVTGLEPVTPSFSNVCAGGRDTQLTRMLLGSRPLHALPKHCGIGAGSGRWWVQAQDIRVVPEREVLLPALDQPVEIVGGRGEVVGR